MSTISATEAIYRGYHEVVMQGAPREEFAKVVDMEKYREECVGFTPGWVDADGALQAFAQIYAAFPDLKVDFEELHVVGDRVFGRIRVEATHTGPLFGAPATGKKVSFYGADFVRVENGKVVERWWIVNALVIMQQLGLAPSG